MKCSMKSFLLTLAILLNLLLLSACSLKPVKTTPTQIYVLNPNLPSVNTSKKSSKMVLLVETPKASQAFDTNQMAYVNKLYQLAYFSYNRWADTPAQMLQPLLILSLHNIHYFQAILASSNGVHNDYTLNTQVLQLQQVFLQHPSYIELNVLAQLVNNNTQQVIATQQFNIQVPATEDTPYGGVIAANKAIAKLLQQVTAFCLSNVRPTA